MEHHVSREINEAKLSTMYLPGVKEVAWVRGADNIFKHIPLMVQFFTQAISSQYLILYKLINELTIEVSAFIIKSPLDVAIKCCQEFDM